MGIRIAATVLVAFTGTSAFGSPSSGHSSGRSGGGHSSGGHAVPRGSSGGRPGGGHSSGGHAYSGRPSGGHSSSGYAYSNRSGGYGRGSAYSSAERRHPRAGYGTGSRYGYYGHGYNHGHGHHYGHGHYGGYPYYGYGYYPYYYGAYGYPYGWGYGGVSVGLYYNNSYPAPVSAAPYYGYPSEDSYAGEPEAAPESYASREPRPDESRTGTGALRLVVRPDDASVYVDGQFRGVALRLGTLRLTPGSHRVEVVRPGFRVADRVVDVRLDATASLEVDLAHP